MMRYIDGALEIFAAAVAVVFVAGFVLGLGARWTLVAAAWLQRRAKATDRQGERVPRAKGSGERPTTPRPSFPTSTYPRAN